MYHIYMICIYIYIERERERIVEKTNDPKFDDFFL